MLNKEKLKEWAWDNLKFNNCPENIDDTYILDIINGYQGNCHDHSGKSWTYQEIRNKFTEYKEED